MVLKSDSIFSLHNSISFDKIQTPLAGMQPQIMTEPPLCFTVDTPCCTSLLTSSLRIDNDLNHKFKNQIHHSIRPLIFSQASAF